jgi:PKD domain
MDFGRRRRWGPFFVRAPILTAALLATWASGASAATTLQVNAATGHDTGNCQSAPCQTIGFAITASHAASVSSPVTIQVAAGTYTEDLALGSADSGLTITGAGSGASAATNTVITGVSGNPTVKTDSSGAAASLSLSHVRIVNPPSDANAAISSGATDLALTDVAVDVQGAPATTAISFGGDTTMSGGSVTVENAAAADAIDAARALTLSGTPVSSAGTGHAIQNTGGPTSLSNLAITLSNSSNSSSAVTIAGRGSSLSHTSIGGGWSGTALADSGALDISDSSIASGPSPTGQLVFLADGTTAGSDVSIERTTLIQRSTAIEAIEATDVNLALDSSEVLGGSPGIFYRVLPPPNLGRVLTIASSTVDAGTLGVRDSSPVSSVAAFTDNNAGDAAIVNVQGSILVEPPASTTLGTNATAAVNCFASDVPDTTQAATGTNGAINCATGASGNTFTSSLSSMFANPGVDYTPKPGWSGLDSVPESAISLPLGFSDSTTDLAGNPRVINGIGTCEPGIRDKGAIELTGHGGIVPAPAIASPSSVLPGVAATFTGSAPNVPSGVPLTFSWHSSDGGTGSGTSYVHTFTKPGGYTVSVTVDGAAGCTASKSVTASVHGIDVMTAFTVSPKVFRAAGSGPSVVVPRRQRDGTNVSYQGTEAATTSFTVQLAKSGRLRGKTCRHVSGRHPKGKRCTVYLSVGAFTHSDTPGSNSFHFTGRLLGRKLPPGNYRLRAVPSNPVGKGNAVFAGFTIRK